MLAPAIEMADGYPIEAQLANTIERQKTLLAPWPYSKRGLLPHPGEAREAPVAGEVFRQPDLAATLRKLVEAEQQALAAGKSRKEALQAAYDRFYRGDVADELVRGDARAGRALHEGGPRPLEGEARGARQDELPRNRRLQARRCGRRARRCSRP